MFMHAHLLLDLILSVRRSTLDARIRHLWMSDLASNVDPRTEIVRHLY